MGIEVFALDSLQVLAIGAHPDDVELGRFGTRILILAPLAGRRGLRWGADRAQRSGPRAPGVRLES